MAETEKKFNIINKTLTTGLRLVIIITAEPSAIAAKVRITIFSKVHRNYVDNLTLRFSNNCAQSRNRTGTEVLPRQDFKSCASTSSAIWAEFTDLMHINSKNLQLILTLNSVAGQKMRFLIFELFSSNFSLKKILCVPNPVLCKVR